MAIIACSGEARSGKDTIGEIFQYLMSESQIKNREQYPLTFEDYLKDKSNNTSRFEIKKFAYKVKQITSLLTGIPIEDLKNEEVKNSYLPECWDYIKLVHSNGIPQTSILSKDYTDGYGKGLNRIISEEEYQMTVRQFMFTLATDAIRDRLHPDTWVNALMVDYDAIERWKANDKPSERDKYPNWIITDWRFENEGKAIELRNGIKIRVERQISLRYPKEWEYFIDNVGDVPINEKEFMYYCKHEYPKLYNHLTHQSETELDKYVDTDYFKYCIYNNGSIEDLIKQCEEILIKEKLI